MEKYLQSTEYIDWKHPAIVNLAAQLTDNTDADHDTAKKCFEWVRDNIRHSWDYRLNPVTCKASEVLQHKTGYCYAKSHLLAALLRANSIPAGSVGKGWITRRLLGRLRRVSLLFSRHRPQYPGILVGQGDCGLIEASPFDQGLQPSV
jgi:transglutaminase-like putative cysteine protease